MERDSLLQHRQQCEFATKNAIKERTLVQQRLASIQSELDQVVFPINNRLNCSNQKKLINQELILALNTI